jgi:hypothetical protein
MRIPTHPLARLSLLAATACLAAGVPACRQNKAKSKASAADPSQVVAKVDDAALHDGGEEEGVPRQPD